MLQLIKKKKHDKKGIQVCFSFFCQFFFVVWIYSTIMFLCFWLMKMMFMLFSHVQIQFSLLLVSKHIETFSMWNCGPKIFNLKEQLQLSLSPVFFFTMIVVISSKLHDRSPTGGPGGLNRCSQFQTNGEQNLISHTIDDPTCLENSLIAGTKYQKKC